MNRLARLAKTDLIGRDYAVTGFAERLNALFPGRRAKVAAMHDHHSSAVWLLRTYVHVRHVDVIPLRSELELMDFVGVFEAFQLGAVLLMLVSATR
jgi:hypothetical protein